MSAYSIAASAQVNGKVPLRFKGPGGFSLAFEMETVEALEFALDIISTAERAAIDQPKEATP